jgi:hypothetical protein
MFAAASRYLVRRSELASSSVRRFASIKDQFEEYGKMVFTGKVAEEYLSKHGSSSELLNDPTWVNHSSDTVAEAVFDWYVSIDQLACCCSGSMSVSRIVECKAEAPPKLTLCS